MILLLSTKESAPEGSRKVGQELKYNRGSRELFLLFKMGKIQATKKSLRCRREGEESFSGRNAVD